jgi:hypothetical protein
MTAAAEAAEAKRALLMLPAPVENPLLDELNALAASLAASPASVPAPALLPPAEQASVRSGPAPAAQFRLRFLAPAPVPSPDPG